MAVPLTTKLVAGSLVSCSVVGGGALIGVKYFGKEPEKKLISSLLREKNPEKRLLAKSNDGSEAEGKAAGKSYLDSNKNVWSIDKGTSKGDGSDNAPIFFINKCTEKSGVSVEDERDTTYSQVLNYCTRDTLIKDLISRSRRFLVNSSGQDTSGGNTAGGFYKSKNTNNQKGEDKGALDNGNEKYRDSEAPDTFKQKCVDKSSEKAYSQSTLVEDYGLVLEWCTTGL